MEQERSIRPKKASKAKIIVKAPTQERSRQTVATILDACSRLILSEGFYAITTDTIAKEAGVSIGSLYQFFGNKESVVQGLVKNIMEEDKRIFAERLRDLHQVPDENKIAALIELIFEVYRRDHILRAKLSSIQYYVTEPALVSEFILFFEQMIRSALSEIPGKRAENTSYILVHTIIGLVNSLSLDNPNYINDPAILNEMTQLIYRYLGLPVK